jgi:hypothetical protein
MKGVLMALVAGQLAVATPHASDMVDRSNREGFLAKYLLSGAASSRTALEDYDKFITANVNYKKGGNGISALPSHSNLAEHGPATGNAEQADMNAGSGESAVADRSFVALRGEPVSPEAETFDPTVFTVAGAEPSVSIEDSAPPKVVDKKLFAPEKAVQNPLAATGYWIVAIGIAFLLLSARMACVGAGLVALPRRLGGIIRRSLQPATVLASSSAVGSIMSINMATSLQAVTTEQTITSPRTAAGSSESGGKNSENIPDDRIMAWNHEKIPVRIALRIGWNLPIDVVGAGVYGGIAKRDGDGRIVVGHEWPENNVAPPAHNPVHSFGPYLDFSKYNASNSGYSKIASLIQQGSAQELESLFQSVPSEGSRRKLANLVMTGGARPLHMCGMGRGGDTSKLIRVLIKYGAEVNAKDNYEFTPMDRLSSNNVAGNRELQSHGGVRGHEVPSGVPQWDSDEFMYSGLGQSHDF